MTKNTFLGAVSNSLPLDRSENAIGQVQSLFENSFNLVFGTEMVNVANQSMPCSSFGMKLDTVLVESLLRNLEIGDRVLQKGSSLVFYSTLGGVFTVDLAELAQLDLRLLSVEPTPDRLEALSLALAELNLAESIGLPIDDRTLQILGTLCQPAPDAETRYQAFSFLVGRGQGLTPSGDDVILGYLLTRRMFDPNFLFDKRFLEISHEKTTLISANYLRVLYDGFVSEYIRDLCGAIAKSNLSELPGYARAIMKVGHTSGSDMLLGMSLATDAIIGPGRAPCRVLLQLENHQRQPEVKTV